jgi:hypothetical protein
MVDVRLSAEELRYIMDAFGWIEVEDTRDYRLRQHLEPKLEAAFIVCNEQAAAAKLPQVPR